MALPTAPPPGSEQVKRRQLVVAKRRATALLVAVTAVFVLVTVWGGRAGWVSYVQATAEASMVGALADWFAVTALFRHPLGLPIPHTAIIVERKAQFGETLGSFVQESFLTPDAIVGRIRAADPLGRVTAWIADPGNAARAAGHAAQAMAAATGVVGDDEVQGVIEGMVRQRLGTVALAPLAGRALALATRHGRHHEPLDAALRGLDSYLAEHRHELHDRLEHHAPWWLPGAVEDRIFGRLVEGARTVLQEMAADPDHELRRELDTRLAQLAAELQTSPEMGRRGDQLRDEVLAQPGVLDWLASLWAQVKAELGDQAGDEGSELRRRLAAAITSAGERLSEDADLAGKVNDGLESAARYVAEHFSGEIAGLVSATIARWDADETSRRLELLLGPDLQYIRINGTVVGGAAGLMIHALARLLGS